jgi:hypothetical protein
MHSFFNLNKQNIPLQKKAQQILNALDMPDNKLIKYKETHHIQRMAF